MSSQEEYTSIEVQLSGEVSEVMESRGIHEDEVKIVIHEGETTGKKLYQPENNRYLAKKRLGEATFYVEYSVSGENKYLIHTAYSHMAELEESNG